jgi:5-methylcytosine-specific restriction endonuclease McrA
MGRCDAPRLRHKSSRTQSNTFRDRKHALPNAAPPHSRARRQRRKVTGHMKRVVAAGQRWRCAGCDELLPASYEVDHTVPLFSGGSSAFSNLRALCNACHGAKTVVENAERDVGRLEQLVSPVPPPLSPPLSLPVNSSSAFAGGLGSGPAIKARQKTLAATRVDYERLMVVGMVDRRQLVQRLRAARRDITGPMLAVTRDQMPWLYPPKGAYHLCRDNRSERL